MAKRNAVFKYVTEYFHRVLQSDFKAFYPYKSQVWQLTENILPEHPGNIQQLLQQFKEKLELNGMHDGCGRLIAGFNPNTGNYPSALGVLYMMLADIHKAPDWRVVDGRIIRWLLDMIGYGKQAEGFLVSGGTSASLVAMLAARETFGIALADSDKAVVYLADTVHICAYKALKAVGLCRVIFREVKHDSRRKMIVSDLEQKIKQDINEDLCPFMVIGTMGEVDSGAIDPLAEIADITAKYGLWFHVDAAYGGFFLMCDEIKDNVKGVDKADSVIVNLHKGLFQPFGCAAVLLRNGNREVISKLFASQQKNILETVNPLEEKAPFRSFPAWMFLNIMGLNNVAVVTMEKIKLAKYLYDYLQLCPDVAIPIKPELSKVIFFMESDHIDTANTRTEKLLQALNRDRQMLVTSTKINDSIYIHICISAFRTHLSDVEHFLQRLKTVAQQEFGLVFPDLGDFLSLEQEADLRDLEKLFLGIEVDLANLHFPTMVANAAESATCENEASLAGSNKAMANASEDYTVPLASPSRELIDSMAKTTITHTKPSLSLPEQSTSLHDTLRTLSLFLSQRKQEGCRDTLSDKSVQMLLEPAILGHFLMASTNRFSGQRASSPGNIELEEIIPDWLRDVTGFPTSAKGVLQNDSCAADILCLLTARCHRLPHPEVYHKAIVYASAATLQVIAQPLHVIGLHQCLRSEIGLNNQQLDIDSLMKSIKNDLQDSKRLPFLVILSISKTGLRAENNKLKSLVSLCHQNGVWIHIHVSEGAPFLLKTLRHCVAMTESGLCDADSISINLTECLCQPQEVAAALVRDHTLLLSSLIPERHCNCLRDLATVEYEPASYSLELTRPSRAVAVWFSMYLHGAKKLRQHIEQLTEQE